MPGRHLTDHQVRLYMSLRRNDTPSVAAAKASFSTASAYRVESEPRLPWQKQTPRSRLLRCAPLGAQRNTYGRHARGSDFLAIQLSERAKVSESAPRKIELVLL